MSKINNDNLSFSKQFKRFLYPMALIVGFVAVSLYSLNLKTHVPAKPASQYDLEVLYSNEGYSPSTMEIPVGTRVAFKNSSDIPMWTASDPHPVHTDFSTFDSRRSYQPGEAYIFQFSSTGTYGYHNHEKSIHRGLIKVTDRMNPVPTIDKTKENQRAVRDKFLAMFKEGDPGSVFTVIDSIEADYSLSRDCHDMAHDLGHRAYELYGFSGAMTFTDNARLSHTSVDDMCAGGYMHGILEEVFLHRPELKDDPGNICSSIPKANRDSCFHGVGHGLMFVFKRDIPMSLNGCRALEKPYFSRCFEGVWMEMFWGATEHAGANSLGWTLEQPLAPCKNAKEDEKPACFLYAHLGYLRTHTRDFNGALRLCTNSKLNVSDEGFCLKGIGITLMKHFTSQHLEQSEKYVANLSEGQKDYFYQGVIGYALLSNVPKKNLQKFCNSLVMDRDICNRVLERQ